MKIKLLQKILLITGLALFVTVQLQGQSLREAIETFNTGMELVDTDIEAAIENIERSHEMALQLGAEGEELQVQAEIQLPGLYYSRALAIYRERDIPGAVDAFEQAIEKSEQFDDPETKRRSESVLHQLYAMLGDAQFRETNNEEALELFDKALEINPQHARSYLGKSLVYRRLEDTENFKRSIDRTIETALATENEQIFQTAESTARDYFLLRGIRAKGESEYERALELLKTSLEYDQSFSETHFIIASIYNEQSLFQNAVNSARRAISLTDGSQNETAKIYFELGKAYEGLGNSEQACDAYKNAAHGQYEASAKYQMEHILKCQ